MCIPHVIDDTDHMTPLEWGSGAVGQRLHERIRALFEREPVTTQKFIAEAGAGAEVSLAHAIPQRYECHQSKNFTRVLGAPRGG